MGWYEQNLDSSHYSKSNCPSPLPPGHCKWETIQRLKTNRHLITVATLSEPPLPEVLIAHGYIKARERTRLFQRNSSYRLRSLGKLVLAPSKQLFNDNVVIGRGELRWRIVIRNLAAQIKTNGKPLKGKSAGARSGAVPI